MIAVRDGSLKGVISIGRNFTEAVSGRVFWKVVCKHEFAIRFDCTGDEACAAAKSVMQSHGNPVLPSISFQRVEQHPLKELADYSYNQMKGY